MSDLIIVIDHLGGARRGQRQELAADRKIRFGRHPDSEVAFDAYRDLDASSRHAELRAAATGWSLVDVGSSNGTFVDGRRITELAVAADAAVTIQFGGGGPRVRLFAGERTAALALPPPVLDPQPRRWRRWALVGALAIVGALVMRMLAL